MSRWRVAGRTAAKRESDSARNQDRWAARSAPTVRVAVADGATQSFRAGPWADMLVQAFVAGKLAPGRQTERILTEIDRLASAWKKDAILDSDAPWHQQARALRGGGATLVGLELRRHARRWNWAALAIGDANLFIVSEDGSLRRSFPLRADRFEPSPLLVSTRAIRNARLHGAPFRARGSYNKGDTFLLASDAVAWWILDTYSAGSMSLSVLRAAVRSQGAFGRFVQELRAQGVPDDDMTLVMVRRA